MPNGSIAEKTTSVLVVDDEPNMRKTLADILHDEGYEVNTAASGIRGYRPGSSAAHGLYHREKAAGYRPRLGIAGTHYRPARFR